MTYTIKQEGKGYQVIINEIVISENLTAEEAIVMVSTILEGDNR